MKTIKIAFVLMLSAFAMQAQENPKFTNAMAAALGEWQKAKSPDEIMKVTNQFERIALVEPKEWLPLYYCALNKVTSAFQINDPKKIDELVDNAEEYLVRASEISPENSEIFTLQAMCMGARTMVDPMNRSKTYGPQGANFLELAKKYDPNNPRIYLYEGQSMFYRPEAFGGGKKVAMPYLIKANELFISFVPKSKLHPTWGKDQAMSMLEKCK